MQPTEGHLPGYSYSSLSLLDKGDFSLKTSVIMVFRIILLSVCRSFCKLPDTPGGLQFLYYQLITVPSFRLLSAAKAIRWLSKDSSSGVLISEASWRRMASIQSWIMPASPPPWPTPS